MVQAENEKQPTAIALGNFDGLHLGHQAVIQSAVQTGILPIAMVIHCAYSIVTKAQLAQGIDSLGAQSIFLEFEQIRQMSGETFVREVLIEQYHAQILCCGYNFHFGKDGICDVSDLQRICDEMGLMLIVSAEIETQCHSPISSTYIRRAIQDGEMEQVKQLLGRPYSVTLTVMEGEQRGRRLGFPTINQKLPLSFVVPRFGVYATQTVVDGHTYASVTNIGVRPTYLLKTPQSETYIIGFSGNLYEQKCTVLFHSFLREERKFDSTAQLQAQIEADIVSAVELLKG